MKRLSILFMALLITFCGVWVYRSMTPVNRPEDSVVTPDTPWWENSKLPQADPKWILDPEIPANCIPVPGEDELYMQIDDDGKIIKYRRRTFNEEDGLWHWMDVDPNIPVDYEAVQNLENVYKTVDKDGNISYYKYIRNEDGSYAFVPVDENGEPLSSKNEEENTDIIPENYIRVVGNIYAVYNEHGVCIGYKERLYDEESGKYYWKDAERPADDASDTNHGQSQPDPSTTPSNPIVTLPPIDDQPTLPNESAEPTVPDASTSVTGPSGIPDEYIETETITSKEIKGGWIITYQTIVTRVYDSDGDLLTTKKEGPNEISREKMTDDTTEYPDPNKIAGALKEEYARVSVGLLYMDDLAKEVLTIINAERAAAGLPAMVLNNTSNAYLLSTIRASDMAIYNHHDYDSPMYGEVGEMAGRFDVSVEAISELLWQTSSGKNATQIASRLQLMNGGRFGTNTYSDIGLTIVSKGGYYYINMVLIQ